jgi:hypothetical protein
MFRGWFYNAQHETTTNSQISDRTGECNPGVLPPCGHQQSIGWLCQLLPPAWVCWKLYDVGDNNVCYIFHNPRCRSLLVIFRTSYIWTTLLIIYSQSGGSNNATGAWMCFRGNGMMPSCTGTQCISRSSPSTKYTWSPPGIGRWYPYSNHQTTDKPSLQVPAHVWTISLYCSLSGKVIVTSNNTDSPSVICFVFQLCCWYSPGRVTS